MPYSLSQQIRAETHDTQAAMLKKALGYAGFALLCAIMLLPLLSVGSALFTPQWDVLAHLWQTYLGEVLTNTLLLSLSVGISALILGTSLAWMVAVYEFPAKRVLEKLLMLPLCIPAYVLGFTYFSAFEYGGLGYGLGLYSSGYWGIDDLFRSPFGLFFALTLNFYPYVYILSLGAFREQNVSHFESALSLGVARRKIFFKVALPMARPSLFIGLALVLMETLADFGTVSLFGVETLSTAVYQVWFGMFNRLAAAQISCLLLGISLALFIFESRLRRKRRYTQVQGNQTRGTLHQNKASNTTPAMRYGCLAAICGVLLFALALPFSVLVHWIVQYPEDQNWHRLLHLCLSTIKLASMAAVVTMAVGLCIAAVRRRVSHKGVATLASLSMMGYALPGVVLAVGIYSVLGALQGALDALPFAVPLTLFGSSVGLIFAYCVRFSTLGYGAVHSGFQKVSPNIDRAAASLGRGGWYVAGRVYLALLRPEVLSGLLLVMIEVIKEMPATLMLRPFGVNTLATYVWEVNSEGLPQEAAAACLLIALVGLIPIVLTAIIHNQLRKKHKNTQK